MKLAVMQPYFMPYIGYWQMINLVDKYVIFDDVNYINRGWINRNRILINGEPHFINIPIIKASQNKLIKEIYLCPDKTWCHKNMRMIELAYSRAPFYKEVLSIVQNIMFCKEDNLALFLVHAISQICDYLQIDTMLLLSSNIPKDNSLKGQYKIIDICKSLGADEYINAIGGTKLYCRELFLNNGINLSFLRTNDICYKQFNKTFQPDLSILDVLMFNSKSECKKLLEQYDLV